VSVTGHMNDPVAADYCVVAQGSDGPQPADGMQQPFLDACAV